MQPEVSQPDLESAVTQPMVAPLGVRIVCDAVACSSSLDLSPNPVWRLVARGHHEVRQMQFQVAETALRSLEICGVEPRESGSKGLLVDLVTHRPTLRQMRIVLEVQAESDPAGRIELIARF